MTVSELSCMKLRLGMEGINERREGREEKQKEEAGMMNNF